MTSQEKKNYKYSYRKKIDEILTRINDEKDIDYISVYQESGMYTILKYNRRISPVMTAKECFYTLSTLEEVL